MSKAYIVGAGPGDPKLLTIAAVEALRRADVVLCDRLVGFDVKPFLPAEAEVIFVGKHAGEQDKVQAQIYFLFARFAGTGKTLVRLKGGDPYVFGRGAEEYETLLDLGYEVSIVPGITSAIAVPALAGIPVTMRNVSGDFAVITGHASGERSIDWTKYSRIDTLIVLMGVKNRADIAQALIKSGRTSETPVAFIENGSTARVRTVTTTLGAVAQGAVSVNSPAVFVIGDVVKYQFNVTSNIKHLTFDSLTA